MDRYTLPILVLLLTFNCADQSLGERRFDRDELDEKAYDGETQSNQESLKIGGIIESFKNIFKSGDAQRYATLNFVYQLACYSDIKGSILKKALWTKLRFDSYGCYCGAGNYHGNYLDTTDKCCMVHDFCYYRVRQKYNLTLGCHTYLVSYNVSCCHEEKYTKCTDSGPSASRELCECDQAMANCVAKSASTYEAYKLNDHSNCKGYKSSSHPGLTQIIASCKAVFNPIFQPKIKYGSQGSCPVHVNTVKKAKKKKSWWGK